MAKDDIYDSEYDEISELQALLQDKSSMGEVLRALNRDLAETRNFIKEINELDYQDEKTLAAKREHLNHARQLVIAMYEVEKQQQETLSKYQTAQLEKQKEIYFQNVKYIESIRNEIGDDEAQRRLEKLARERREVEEQIRNNPMSFLTDGRFDNSGILGKLVTNIGNAMLTTDTNKQGVEAAIDIGIQKLSEKFPGLGSIANILIKGFSALQKKLSKSIEDAVGIYKQYLGPIDTRLQGTEKTFDDLLLTVRNNLTSNQFVNQKDYIQKMSSLVEQGIAYNIEERTLWATVGEKIATTFDVLDQTLTRLIRLQQFDMTRSALGSESRLTQFLNSQYSDTSYLSNTYDTINQSLIEATSQMTPEQATSFMYNVQKWLGSLYSVGMSDAGVQSLAKGITYLSTGDISSLSSNTQLQTLLGLALSRSGQSLSGLLTSGMQAEDVDILMKSIVEYLSTIADNTDSQVLKNQWAQVLGVTMSDLRAMSNLTADDISNILNETITQQQAYTEVGTQLAEHLADRTHIQERLDNLIDNFFVSFGQNIAGNTESYMGYLVTNAISKLGDALGNNVVGTALSTVGTLGGLIVQGEGIYKTIQNFINSLTGQDEYYASNGIVYGGSGGSFDEEDEERIMSGFLGRMYRRLVNGGASSLAYLDWNSSAYNIGSRGEGFLGLTGSSIGYYTPATLFETPNVITATSKSTAVASPSGTSVENFGDIEQNISDTGDNIVGQQEEMSDTIDNLYDKLFENQSTPLKIRLAEIDEEALELLNKILAINKRELSADIERYIDNNSSSVETLTNTLYAIRSM